MATSTGLTHPALKANPCHFLLNRPALRENSYQLLKRMSAARGVHYLVTRFGPRWLKALAFDEKYARGSWGRHTEVGELVHLVSRHLGQGDLLVMGCGGATILDGLDAPSLNSAVGIDLSPEAIRLAAARFTSPKISFLVEDMEQFKCPRNYDVILFSESLYYVPETRRMALLRRLGSRLKAGGVLVCTLAEPQRYQDLLGQIRQSFNVLTDRLLHGESRHVLIFMPQGNASAMAKRDA